jgi:hypothetical protein
MATHRTEFDIDASDEQVWAILVDFDHYAVSLTLSLPGRPNLNVKAVLQEVTPNRRLTWRGHLGADQLFTGYREFALHPVTENKVRVTHVEDLQRWIAPVFEKLMGHSVQHHHDAFNESLRNRAETITAQAATGG